MNMKKTALFVLIVVLFVGCKSAQMTKEQREQQKVEVANRVNRGEYIIDVSKIFPVRGQVIHPAAKYDITVSNDSVYSYLPYIGRSTAIATLANDGLKFHEPIKDYKVKMNAQGTAWEISFNTRIPNYTFYFYMTIQDNGESNIRITSYERDPISFAGQLRVE